MNKSFYTQGMYIANYRDEFDRTIVFHYHKTSLLL